VCNKEGRLRVVNTFDTTFKAGYHIAKHVKMATGLHAVETKRMCRQLTWAMANSPSLKAPNDQDWAVSVNSSLAEWPAGAPTVREEMFKPPAPARRGWCRHHIKETMKGKGKLQ
jgi:hypothetical protein